MKLQLFIGVKLLPTHQYLFENSAKGKFLKLKLHAEGTLRFETILGTLYLGKALRHARLKECQAIEKELKEILQELSSHLDEKGIRLYILPQKLLCPLSLDPAHLDA